MSIKSILPRLHYDERRLSEVPVQVLLLRNMPQNSRGPQQLRNSRGPRQLHSAGVQLRGRLIYLIKDRKNVCITKSGCAFPHIEFLKVKPDYSVNRFVGTSA